MYSPFLALSWELLARQRWWLALTAGYLGAICVAVPLLPPEWRGAGLAWGLTAVVAGAMVFVVGMASHGGEAPLELPGGAFPRHLFLLPVPTWALVLPPVALGGAAVAGGWALTAVFVLRPCGAEVGVLWPAVMAAAVLASTSLIAPRGTKMVTPSGCWVRV